MVIKKINIEKSVKYALKCICKLCYASTNEKQLIYYCEKLDD